MKTIAAALAVCSSFLVLSALITRAQDLGKVSAGAKAHYDSASYAELQKAPEKARNRSNPLQNDPEAVSAGAILFEQHCAGCHGGSAQGGRKGPSLRAAEVQGAPPGAIFWLLTNGVVRKGMPVWSKLPAPQRWQLVRYIKTLGESAPAADSEAPKP